MLHYVETRKVGIASKYDNILVHKPVPEDLAMLNWNNLNTYLPNVFHHSKCNMVLYQKLISLATIASSNIIVFQLKYETFNEQIKYNFVYSNLPSSFEVALVLKRLAFNLCAGIVVIKSRQNNHIH